MMKYMLLHDARRAARLNAAGEHDLLDEQDRSLWDQGPGRGAGPVRQPGRARLPAAAAG